MTPYHKRTLRRLGKHFGFDIETPVKKFNAKQMQVILYGSKEKIKDNIHGGKFDGVIGELERVYRKTKSEETIKQTEELMVKSICPSCKGKKLKKEILAVKINNASIIDAGEMTLEDFLKFLNELKLNADKKQIANSITEEIKTKVENLIKIRPRLFIDR